MAPPPEVQVPRDDNRRAYLQDMQLGIAAVTLCAHHDYDWTRMNNRVIDWTARV
jgi:hypothetical protein